MPSYDYFCPNNGQTLEVEHKMAEKIATWGELCRRLGMTQGATPADAEVVRLITGGSTIRASSLGSKHERPCDSGPCGAPACGSGGCGF